MLKLKKVLVILSLIIAVVGTVLSYKKTVNNEYAELVFVLNGGINDEDNEVLLKVGEKLVLKDAFKEGAIFTGWYLSQDMTEESKIDSVSLQDGQRVVLYAGFNEVFNISQKNTIHSTTEFSKNLEQVVVPKNVKRIEDFAFFGNENLKEVLFEEGSKLESIGEKAFWGCKNLQHIELPSSLTKIEGGAFGEVSLSAIDTSKNANFDIQKGCLIELNTNTLLKIESGATVFESVREIGDFAFSETKIEEFTVGETIEKIGNYAFLGCKNLKKIDFSNATNLTHIGDFALSETGLTEVCFPKSLIFVGEGLFRQSKNLKKVEFDENSRILNLPNYCFVDCTNLEDIKLPKKLQTIGDNCFFNCKSLPTIEFGLDLMQIGKNAFFNCVNLKNVVFENVDDWEVCNKNKVVKLSSSEVKDGLFMSEMLSTSKFSKEKFLENRNNFSLIRKYEPLNFL